MYTQGADADSWASDRVIGGVDATGVGRKVPEIDVSPFSFVPDLIGTPSELTKAIRSLLDAVRALLMVEKVTCRRKTEGGNVLVTLCHAARSQRCRNSVKAREHPLPSLLALLASSSMTGTQDERCDLDPDSLSARCSTTRCDASRYLAQSC